MGRLIDADDLLIAFGNALNNANLKIGYGFMEWVVNEQPTVDLESRRPVAHIVWREREKQYVTYDQVPPNECCYNGKLCYTRRIITIENGKVPFCSNCDHRLDDCAGRSKQDLVKTYASRSPWRGYRGNPLYCLPAAEGRNGQQGFPERGRGQA